MQVGDGDKVGDDDQFVGDHHQGQEQGEGQVLAREFQSGKGEGRGDNDHHHEGRRHQGKDQGVQEVPAQIHGGEGIHIVLEGRGKGKELGDVFGVVGAVALDGGQQHPVEREQHDDGPHRQEEVIHCVENPLAAGGPALDFVKVQLVVHVCHPLNTARSSC